MRYGNFLILHNILPDSGLVNGATISPYKLQLIRYGALPSIFVSVCIYWLLWYSINCCHKFLLVSWESVAFLNELQTVSYFNSNELQTAFILTFFYFLQWWTKISFCFCFLVFFSESIISLFLEINNTKRWKFIISYIILSLIFTF